jgi:GNAT superfamily N-acetyltransferase
MKDGSPLVSLSILDEARFGVRTARAVGVRQETLPAVLRFCRDNDVVLAIARCSAMEIRAAQAMEGEGFLLMDTLLFYLHRLRDVPEPQGQDAAFVRPLRPGEEEAVSRVAAEAFRGYSGHYHADPRLDRGQCDETYRSWAVRACVSPEATDQVLVAEHEGAIAGFAALQRNSPEEAQVVLFGVDPALHGQGIARRLLAGSLGWCQSRRVSRLLYATQITNPVQRALMRLGFEPSHAVYTFHKWFDRS